ncbi:RHS repeat domain-containing protein [Pseudomonas coronafaciens]|uniref:RHS repeat domain-containing protein n=1 Tax=Pseudomonas coronafaciens TaxID=53409 RepID=UPI001F45E930|nr:RHS repeat domain-containing protein [Pseudomonas coronafaciens]
MRKSKKIYRFCLPFLLIFTCVNLLAADNIYWLPSGVPPAFKSAKEGCDYMYLGGGGLVSLSSRYRPEHNIYVGDSGYKCGLADVFGNWTGEYFGMTISKSEVCSDDMLFDYFVGACRHTTQKGHPNNVNSCEAPSLERGNPVNIATGNKFQEEHDLVSGSSSSIVVDRYYNSSDKYWRHSYSAHLDINVRWITLVDSDGREIKFEYDGSSYFSRSEGVYLLKLADGWSFKSRMNKVYYFDLSGQLIKVVSNGGGTQYVLRKGGDIVIRNDFADEVVLTEDFLHQPVHLSAKDVDIRYEYAGGRLVKRTKVYVGRPGSADVRTYHYENQNNDGDRLLTGITDERGVRLVTWTYSPSQKVVFSEHADGAQSTRFIYESEESTSVVGELGRKLVYHFKLILGVKRIVSIEGEPTPDCPASNSTYTYNDRGLVLTKTDAKGLITAYSYNDRGLEISRTEASGTTLARTTTTEWDTDRLLPIKVTEPNRVTVYSYDNQGRELTRQSTSR